MIDMATILALSSTVTISLVGLLWKLTDRRIARIEDSKQPKSLCSSNIQNICNKMDTLARGQDEMIAGHQELQRSMNNFILKVETKFAYINGKEGRNEP